MPDTVVAVNALVAATKGTDTEALAAAIESGAFLEETPGDDRQKLRGSPSCVACQLIEHNKMSRGLPGHSRTDQAQGACKGARG